MNIGNNINKIKDDHVINAEKGASSNIVSLISLRLRYKLFNRSISTTKGNPTRTSKQHMTQQNNKINKFFKYRSKIKASY